MTVLGLAIVKEVMKRSHLPIVKLENKMFGDTIDGAQVITVSTQGVSERGAKSWIRFEDFPDTEEGRKKATELFDELEAWNAKEEGR